MERENCPKYARSPLHEGDEKNVRFRKQDVSNSNLPDKASVFDAMKKDKTTKVKIDHEYKKSNVFRHLVPEVVIGYAFWSLFHALAPMIWFYPLNELEISGYELFGFCFLSPVLHCFPGFTNLLTSSRTFVLLLRLGMVGGIYSFQAGDTLTRLISLALGVSCAMLNYSYNLYVRNSLQRSMGIWSLILSYMLLLATRIWFTSLTPAWSDVTTNTIILTTTLMASVDRYYCDYDVEYSMKGDVGVTRRWYESVLVGGGLGSFLYITHTLLGEVSIITRWTVKGYPSTGPQPNPYGYVVYLAVTLGLLLATNTSLAHSVLWWLMGLLATIGFYLLSRWSGYLCGLILTVYVTSLTIALHDQATHQRPGTTLTTALFLYVAETLFSVWCTAYNFVPGGVYTREHTDWLLAFLMFSMAMSLFTVKRSSRVKIHCTFDNALFARIYIGLCVVMCVSLATGGFIYRIHHTKYQHPPKVAPKQFTAGIWTYHFGYDNKGWPSLERAAQLINDSGVDVITLLESDASKPYLGNNDLSSWLSERLGMYVDFGPSTKDHTWGNLLLSKYPIIKSTHHLLPSPHGELAPAISAIIDFSGSPVLFITTHMGNDRDSLDRKLQADYLSELSRTSRHPTVFLGYVTSAPGSRDYTRLREHGHLKDIDSTDEERWCEYIMYHGLIRLGYARISHAGLSDTEMQMAEFQIPTNPKNYQDHSQVVKDVPEQERFTDKFGSYKDGHSYSTTHRYHMSTPKYFRNPQQSHSKPNSDV